MATSSRRSSGPVIRSLSPTGRFYNSPSSSPSTGFASSTSSAFSSPILHRSTSPSRVAYSRSSQSSPSVRFTLDRPISPQISSVRAQPTKTVKRTCMCSPTTHPGSFRCSLHKNNPTSNNNSQTTSYPNNRLNARRSAMTNSLVRIGTVEGDLVKRALAALIRPSSHQQRRRGAFQPRPSRLSIMSKAEDENL